MAQVDVHFKLQKPYIQAVLDLNSVLGCGYVITSRPQGLRWSYVVSLQENTGNNQCVVISPQSGLYDQAWCGKYFLTTPHVCLSTADTQLAINRDDGQFKYCEGSDLTGEWGAITFTIESSLNSPTQGVMVWEIFLPQLHDATTVALKIRLEMIFVVGDEEFFVKASFVGSLLEDKWPRRVRDILGILLPLQQTTLYVDRCKSGPFCFEDSVFINNAHLVFLLDYFVQLQATVIASGAMVAHVFGVVAKDYNSLFHSGDPDELVVITTLQPKLNLRPSKYCY
jgi:hypothetical protein